MFCQSVFSPGREKLRA